MTPKFAAIDPTACEDFCALRHEAATDGVNFIERLWNDWMSGANRFDGPGEVFLGAWRGPILAGVGGLNRDPFAGGAAAARLRRFYIRPAFRRSGVGRALLSELLGRVAPEANEVRLRTHDPRADAFYRACGFEPYAREAATHILRLRAG